MIYGLKHLFKVSITTEFIFSTFWTKEEDPLPIFPHLSINILSKSLPIPKACTLNLDELVVIKFMHSSLLST